MLRKLLLALFVLAVLAVVIGLWLPERQRVQRSIEVARPAATVFVLLNGFTHFQRWSPWLERDPGAEYRFSGPANGVGARMEWEGNPRMVGAGWQEIIASHPHDRIDLRLEFGPEGAVDGFFLIEPVEEGSVLTWGLEADMSGGRGFFGDLMARYLGLFLDRWIGDELVRGLERFKIYAESLPPADFGQADVRIVTVRPEPILFVAGSSSQAPEDIAAALADAFSVLSEFLEAHQVPAAGQPLAITRSWDESGYHFDAAIPVEGELPPLAGRLEAGWSPGGRAVRMVHRGAYENILESYEKLAAFMAARDLRAGAVSWEHYLSDPATTPPEQRLTQIFIQLAD